MSAYVLMIQTDPDDMFITESTISEIGNEIAVKYVQDLEEMEKMIGQGELPHVILLNDRGPLHTGKELIKKLKANPIIGHLPVVVLGEVTSHDHIRSCYKLGASSYIIKPSSMAATRAKIEIFFNYWFNVAEV